MKRHRVIYKVEVTVQGDTDLLYVTADDLGTSERHVGFEFRQRVMEIDDSGIVMPTDRQLTFREELRRLGRASQAGSLPREEHRKFIAEKIREAYGEAAEVEVSETRWRISEPSGSRIIRGMDWVVS